MNSSGVGLRLIGVTAILKCLFKRAARRSRRSRKHSEQSEQQEERADDGERQFQLGRVVPRFAGRRKKVTSSSATREGGQLGGGALAAARCAAHLRCTPRRTARGAAAAAASDAATRSARARGGGQPSRAGPRPASTGRAAARPKASMRAGKSLCFYWYRDPKRKKENGQPRRGNFLS